VSEPSAYDRGVQQGEVEARLAGHDRHFAAINGNLTKLADALTSVGSELVIIRLALQRLADGAVSRDATTITTAAALKDAEEARRATSEQRWTPLARTIAIIGALVLVAGLVVTLVAKFSLN
jgi:deoxyribodipyrimidine photolyase